MKEVIDAMAYEVIDEKEAKELLDELVTISIKLVKVKDKLNAKRREQLNREGGLLNAAKSPQTERLY